MRSAHASWRPFAYLIIAIFAVSCSAILIRFCQTSPLIIAFYRQTFSALLLFPFANREEHRGPLTGKVRILLALSGLFLALHFGTWITGLSYTTVARATLLVDLQPVWAAILGALFLHESLHAIEVGAILLVTFGGGLTVASQWGEVGGTFRGDFLSLIGGIAGAAYFLIGRFVRAEISWLRYIYSVYLASAVWLLIFNLILFRTFPLPAEIDIVWIVAMALIPSIAGHGLFNLALRKLRAYVVNAAFLGEPVLAAVLAFLIFQEKPDRFFFLGAVFVFSGLILLFAVVRKRA